ncbi:hypothetical protein FRAHR75_570046 [Frankia sp. Hr75.2]|nr:hypothetical protein FRAHR75_570046 [Frankia sp. Hr75.2]
MPTSSFTACAAVPLPNPPDPTGPLLDRRTRRTPAAEPPHGKPVRHTASTSVTGRRWTFEEIIQTSRKSAALDQHQVSVWTSWHRWAILAMLSHAFLTVPPTTIGESLPPITVNETGDCLTRSSACQPRTGQKFAYVNCWAQWVTAR